ncbi:Malectin-like carbohydrate-binding domain containing protein [Parasponia andersonii]|uniref:Malectin-like carbohydrate-binding domain containing protein n=1 Tax=Parasponia andersonii TaxID=3476 RepID=A0A2P5AI58_PARAD|nr:Malectin-like carbohydrate-binding domain containing protein [Parasponia andersonii]
MAHSQDQSGFISIDCGISADSSYTDQTTGISYISDSTFIDTGVSKSVSPEYKTTKVEQQYWTLRSFPDGVKNCDALRPKQGKGNKYLIRARFLYANYDQNGTVPKFDLYIGAIKWDTVKLINESMTNTMELIHIPSSNYIFVCLVNSGYGTPFISALELKPLENSTYRAPSVSLALYERLDIGSQSNKSIRYKDDVYDRIWRPFNFVSYKITSTSLTVDANGHTPFYPPSSVMQTGVTTVNSSGPLEFNWLPDDPTSKFYVYMYFAEVEQLQPNQTREFNISHNDAHWDGPISPSYLYTTVAYSQYPVSGDKIDYTIYPTENSTLPPILNGLEVYTAVEMTQSPTDEQDVNAMMNIKSKYGLKRNWQGDPCESEDYLWEGLNCKYGGSDSLRIISLDLPLVG